MLLVLADHRPAHLTRVHQALVTLPEDDQRRLGVVADWKRGPHLLTYRQTERTFGLVADALAKDVPDGLPSDPLQRICDDLLEASIPDEFKNASTSLAVDWTDVETFSRPPPRGTSDCADPEASWGHRSGGGPGQDSELFFGYYPSAATMMREEHGPPVPELARRMTVCSCHHDPARALVPVLTAMPGTASRSATSCPTPATPTATPKPGPSRSAQSGAQLVQDLHPLDRGPRGTHHGAIIANGNLYCPATPRTLLEPGPLARDATPDQADAHDQQTAETARLQARPDHQRRRRRLSPGACPAVMGKIRCPLRPTSMTLTRDRPEILTPPGHPPACCIQQTITVPPQTCAKTRRSTTTPPSNTASPTPGAPAPSGPSPPPRTPPATTSRAAGPGSWACTPHALAHLPAGRPQPAHPGRLGRPPGRQRPPRRGRPAPKTRRRRRKTLASLATAAPP